MSTTRPEPTHPKLYLRLYDPDARPHIKSPPPTLLSLRRTSPRGITKHRSNTRSHTKTTVNGSAPKPANTKSRPTNCKTPLFRFSHGGPQRVTKGSRQNEIALTQPCLQPTCKTCRIWHPNLIKAVQQSWEETVEADGHTKNIDERSLAPVPADRALVPSFLANYDPKFESLRTAELARRTAYENTMVDLIRKGEPVLKGILKHEGGNWAQRKNCQSRRDSASPCHLAPATSGVRKKVRFRHVVRLVFRSDRARRSFKSKHSQSVKGE